MKLLSLKQVSCRQTDTVFRNPGIAYGIVAGIVWCLLAAAVYLLIFGRIGGFEMPWGLAAWLSPFLLLFAWLLTKRWQASRRPSNWVVRLRGNDVLIKFRSYENWRLSEDDVQVIELHSDEIAGVREINQRQVTKTSDGNTRVSRRIELELTLKNEDTAGLEKALAAERAGPGWGNQRVRTKVNNYPVSADAGVLRIVWLNEFSCVRPRIKQALAAFSHLAPVVEARTGGTEDFSPAALRKLDEAQQRKQLKELSGRDRIAAMQAARELYHCSLSKASDIVDELIAADGEPPAPALQEDQ
jgi:hypothetical protein